MTASSGSRQPGSQALRAVLIGQQKTVSGGILKQLQTMQAADGHGCGDGSLRAQLETVVWAAYVASHPSIPGNLLLRALRLVDPTT